MKIHPAQQGSVEWMNARAGIPTASEFDQLVTPLFEIRKGEMPVSYLAKKVAERWLGGPLSGFNTFDMDQGNILEEEALPFYELEYGVTVNQVGLILTDDGRVGASPDGLLEVGGLEIKCPQPHAHCKWLLDGKLPKEHAPQVHGSMFVTGAPCWTFMSYRRKFPPLVLIVERDEEIQEAIEEALSLFCDRLDRAYEHLVNLNHGPPHRSAIPTSKPEYEPDMQDVPS